jgi:hypothetical protein
MNLHRLILLILFVGFLKPVSAPAADNDITSPTSRQSLTGLYYVSTEAGFQYRF